MRCEIYVTALSQGWTRHPHTRLLESDSGKITIQGWTGNPSAGGVNERWDRNASLWDCDVEPKRLADVFPPRDLKLPAPCQNAPAERAGTTRFRILA